MNKDTKYEQLSTAGAAKGGVTSLEGLTRFDIIPDEGAESTIGPEVDGRYFLAADVERLLAAPSQGEARDAARYRWLRRFGYQACELTFHDDGTFKWGDDLDTAVDSALALAPIPPSTAPAPDARQSVNPQTDLQSLLIEQAARAMAKQAGWDKWDTATDCRHTPSGNDPDDERDYFRDMAHAALSVIAPAPDARQSVNPQQSELTKRRIEQIGYSMHIQAFKNAVYRADQGTSMTRPEQDEFNKMIDFTRAIEREVLAQTAQAAPSAEAEPIYQVGTETIGSHIIDWNDVSLDDYEGLTEGRHRIVYTAPAPAVQAEDVRNQALEEAALACEAWGMEKVAKWGSDQEMETDAKARAWDAYQCAAAIRALRTPGGTDAVC